MKKRLVFREIRHPGDVRSTTTLKLLGKKVEVDSAAAETGGSLS